MSFHPLPCFVRFGYRASDNTFWLNFSDGSIYSFDGYSASVLFNDLVANPPHGTYFNFSQRDFLTVFDMQLDWPDDMTAEHPGS